MRKIFTSFVIAGMLLMVVPASAQFKAGLTAGLNITTMHYSAGYSDMKTVTGEMKNRLGPYYRSVEKGKFLSPFQQVIVLLRRRQEYMI